MTTKRAPATPPVLPPLGPPHYRGPTGDTANPEAVAAVKRVEAIRTASAIRAPKDTRKK